MNLGNLLDLLANACDLIKAFPNYPSAAPVDLLQLAIVTHFLPCRLIALNLTKLPTINFHVSRQTSLNHLLAKWIIVFDFVEKNCRLQTNRLQLLEIA